MKTHVGAVWTVALAVMVGTTRAQGLPGVRNAATLSRVGSQILADTTAIESGKPFTLAVTLSTNSGWHIYWSNPGESGLATRFSWQMPEGYTVEALPLPLPLKFVQPGDIAGYGYTGKTTFLFKVTPPKAGSTNTSPVQLAGSVSWLCCNKDQCVPGDAKLALSLPRTTAGNANTANGEVFQAASEALPVASAPEGISLTTTLQKSEQGTTWNIVAALKDSPQAVDAFPDNVDGLAVTQLKVDMDKQSARISLTAHQMGGQALKQQQLPLLLVYTDSAGKRRGFFVPVDLNVLGGVSGK